MSLKVLLVVYDNGSCDHIFPMGLGAIAAILAAAPGPSVALWQATVARESDKALDLHQRLLRLWNAINGDNLPACTKYAQTLQQIPAGLPRKPMTVPQPSQQAAIRSALEELHLI